MQTLLSILQQKASEVIAEVCLELPPDSPLRIAEITRSTQPQFGHYQCNSALKIAKALKLSPRCIAEKIVARLLEAGKDMIEGIDIAGQGFLNIRLRPAFLATQIMECLESAHMCGCIPQHRQRVIVEFSSPNIAKELHVGHLRSTIIGDCIARVFEFLGHDVLRLNHIGDWGTQFGMLIAFLRDVHPEAMQDNTPIDLSSLMRWYQEAKEKFDIDLDFKRCAHQQVVALQQGEPYALMAWRKICEISRKGFEEIYDLLDVRIVERGESFYNPQLADIVQDLEDKRLIVMSEGAKCVFMQGFTTRDGVPLPMIVQKSDGGYNYDTTDMAALRQRVAQEKAQRIIIVTDAGQALHFQMIFQAARLAGYYDPMQVRLDHVMFGVVLGPDGKKFKTRSGKTVKLIDLLLEAIERAEKILEVKMPQSIPAERHVVAKILGINAVKYADLSCHRTKDYIFSYDRMLKFDGNTAPFLLYAYVRARSIKRRVGTPSLEDKGSIVLEHSSEIALALHIRQFGEAIESVVRELLPNRLTDYLFTLAEAFHVFFRDCRVEGDRLVKSRLLLCEATARTLRLGLQLLGLKTLEKM